MDTRRARRRGAGAGIAVLLAIIATPASAQAPDASAGDPSLGKVEVTLDLPKDKPYVGEMIMLRMRSFIRADIARDEIIQPPLLNFSWQQLGRDKPIQAMVDGFSVAGVERDLAIFPDTSGRLIIEPFDRHVTIVTSDGQRKEVDFFSKPIYVDIQNHAGIGKPDQWWLPAKSVTITDAWSQPPDEIKPGTLSTRTVTIEAVGLTGDRLPPPPDILAPGTIAFRGPVVRNTMLTEDGPVARGVYKWDLRPATSAPAQMPSIAVPWFDTADRRMRTAALPPVWLAYVGTLVHPSHEKAKPVGLLSSGPLAVGVAGFAWALAAAAFVARDGRRVSYGRAGRRRRRALAAVRRAARAGDRTGFADALVTLQQADGERWRRVSRADGVAPGLQALDAARFGRHPTRSGEPLLPLADEIARLWLAEDGPQIDETEGLPSLDGPIVPPDRVSPRLSIRRLLRLG